MIVIINVIFGAWLWVSEGLRQLPLGMAHLPIVQPTHKAHNVSWYTAGFT